MRSLMANRIYTFLEILVSQFFFTGAVALGVMPMDLMRNCARLSVSYFQRLKLIT